MADFEVHIDLNGRTRQVGLARSNRVRGRETVLFEYADAWLDDPGRFSLQPALAMTRGAFAPPAGQAVFGSIGDSAPDTWGRRLMQRAERRSAEREGRAVRTLAESDYLLGVADETRLGALRLRRVGEEEFQAPVRAGVPALIELGRLLQITERILRDEETDEDLQLIFAPGSSLGGARPKASVTDRHGHLSIAKFPKETDDYSVETWEEIALRLAGYPIDRPWLTRSAIARAFSVQFARHYHAWAGCAGDGIQNGERSGVGGGRPTSHVSMRGSGSSERNREGRWKLSP